MKKKIIKAIYIAAIIACLLAAAAGTYAYYTTSDTAQNVITSGGIEVAIVEQQLVDGSLQPYPNEPIPVMPAHTVSKIVSVRSDEQSAWIRANYTLTIYDADGKKMDVPADELNEVIIISGVADKWTQHEGWWYYESPVGSGETTDPLFEKVTFSGPKMDNKYQLCTVIIDINAEGVQKANNGTTVMEALGWPEN